MAVVAAGVHYPGLWEQYPAPVFSCMGRASISDPQGQGLAPALHHDMAYHPMAAQQPALDAQLAQPVIHKSGGVLLLPLGSGFLVQMAAVGHHLLLLGLGEGKNVVCHQ